MLCPPVCPFGRSCLRSSMSRTVHRQQESSKVDVQNWHSSVWASHWTARFWKQLINSVRKRHHSYVPAFMSDSETLLLPRLSQHIYFQATSKTLLLHRSSLHIYVQATTKTLLLHRSSTTHVHQATTKTLLLHSSSPTPVHPATFKMSLSHHSSQHLDTQLHPRRYFHTAGPNTCTPSHIQDVTTTPLVPTPVHPATSKTLLPSSERLYTQPHPR